jgi:hypothetical protein
METGYKLCLGTVLVLCVLLVFRLVAACRIVLFILVLYIFRLLLNVVRQFCKETIFREIQPYCRFVSEHLEQICSYRRHNFNFIYSSLFPTWFIAFTRSYCHFYAFIFTFQIPRSSSFSVISRSCLRSCRFWGHLCRDPSEIPGSVFSHG